jgi:hypothetical protein
MEWQIRAAIAATSRDPSESEDLLPDMDVEESHSEYVDDVSEEKELTTSSAVNILHCFTDGSSLANPGPAGSACLIQWPDLSDFENGQSLGKKSNNVAELWSIWLLICELRKDISVERVRSHVVDEIRIHSDSAYSINMLEGKWNARTNVELIA